MKTGKMIKQPKPIEVGDCTAYVPARRFIPNKARTYDGSKTLMNNGARAIRAEAALSAHGGGAQYVKVCNRERLTDLLTDLLHWCDREHEEFNSALLMAAHNHSAEK
jgi:hypothetical protein